LQTIRKLLFRLLSPVTKAISAPKDLKVSKALLVRREYKALSARRAFKVQQARKEFKAPLARKEFKGR
jgi:hypothetical protein